MAASILLSHCLKVLPLFSSLTTIRIGTGAWGPPASLRFEILPAWWQRAWAKGVLLLGLICLVGALFQGRMVRLRRRNQLLEGMVEVRTRQVQDKARELERANAALLDQILTSLPPDTVFHWDEAKVG